LGKAGVAGRINEQNRNWSFKEHVMIAHVDDQGLLIPKAMLGNKTEVEIRERPGCLVIVYDPAADPIRGLGKNPVIGPETDASVNHDKYIYTK
jgi:hypothetical protein